MINYGQFCPVTKAAELLGERWTLLVVRELLLGTTRFNELQKALPRASPSILTKRLKELEAAGLLKHHMARGRQRGEYRLTRAGREISALIEQMGIWAMRWAPSRLDKDDLDDYFLMLDISRRLDVAALPVPSATLGFRFRGAAAQPNWWLVVRDGQADLCDRDPGFELDLLIDASLRTFTQVWLGRTALASARRSGRVRISGDLALERSIQHWLGFSAFAAVATMTGRTDQRR